MNIDYNQVGNEEFEKKHLLSALFCYELVNNAQGIKSVLREAKKERNLTAEVCAEKALYKK